MSPRAVLLAGLCLCALQLSLASEDLDWAEPQTALWAIARENAIVVENQKEAAEIVATAASNATASSEALVAAQVAAWRAPVDAAVAKALSAGVTAENVTLCQRIYSLDIQTAGAAAAVPLCVVAARTQYDARVKKLQTVADGILDLIVKTQADIETCGNRHGEFLQVMCRQSKVVWDVLTAQDNKSKAVPTYFQVFDDAAKVIVRDADTCTAAALQRLQFSANLNIKNTVKCLESDIARLVKE